MKHKSTIIILVLVLIVDFTYSQEQNDYLRMGEENAKRILEETLKDSILHNVIGRNQILKDKSKIIDFAELILFDLYGKKEIESQRPYDVYKINEYWLLSGTLPKNKRGGAFLLIIDSRDYRVIRLTHGK
ncbi:MAG: YbbC/YhhH family protein [Flavobacteriaceae bacterium]|nr:YbbC/YhhH family protein [Flavobacteriaceae bacterium]